MNEEDVLTDEQLKEASEKALKEADKKFGTDRIKDKLNKYSGTMAPADVNKVSK
jgi:hypothetical protein